MRKNFFFQQLDFHIHCSRDPVELVALNCTDVEKTAEFFKKMTGMQEFDPNLATADNKYLPKVQKGAKLLGYGDNLKQTASILLLPVDSSTELSPGAYDRYWIKKTKQNLCSSSLFR